MLEFLFAFALARADEFPGQARARIAAIYDGDILIAPDGMFDQGVPSGFSDYRLLTAGEVGYRFVNDHRHHFGPSGLVALTNTAQARHAAGDAYIFEVSGPYQFDFPSGDGYRLVARPTFTSLMMDPTLTSQKSVTQSSLWLTLENRWRYAGWTSGFDVLVRRDTSGLQSSVGVNDASADKFGAHVNVARAHWSADFGYLLNQARGVNLRYRRLEATVGYHGTVFGAVDLLTELTAYRLNFPAADLPRRDVNLGARARVEVPIGEGWTFDVEAAYAHDRGLGVTFDYDRVVVATGFSARGVF